MFNKPFRGCLPRSLIERINKALVVILTGPQCLHSVIGCGLDLLVDTFGLKMLSQFIYNCIVIIYYLRGQFKIMKQTTGGYKVQP